MKKLLKFLLLIIVVFIVVSSITYFFIKNMNSSEEKDKKVVEENRLDSINIIKRGEFKLFGLDERYKDEELKIKDMTFVDGISLYYKVIDNLEEYLEYKKVIKELPDAKSVELDSNFVVIVTSEKPRSLDEERDIGIYEINSDDTTTYIKLKQKENPDYNNDCNNWYAVSKKSLLKENIVVQIE